MREIDDKGSLSSVYDKDLSGAKTVIKYAPLCVPEGFIWEFCPSDMPLINKIKACKKESLQFHLTCINCLFLQEASFQHYAASFNFTIYLFRIVSESDTLHFSTSFYHH